MQEFLQNYAFCKITKLQMQAASLENMYAFPKISGEENLSLWRGGASWRAATSIGVTLAQD